jgi:hypothetical protein
VESVQGAEPSTCHLEPGPHLSENIKSFASLGLTLLTRITDRGKFRAENSFWIHVRKVCRVDANKGSVVDGKAYQWVLDQYTAILAGYYQVHHLSGSLEELASTLTPKAIWSAHFLAREQRLI